MCIEFDLFWHCNVIPLTWRNMLLSIANNRKRITNNTQYYDMVNPKLTIEVYSLFIIKTIQYHNEYMSRFSLHFPHSTLLVLNNTS